MPNVEGLRPTRESTSLKEKCKIIIFTAREIDILNLRAQGVPIPQIQYELFLGKKTIINTFSDTMEKLGVKNVTQAVLKGNEIGIVNRKQLRRNFDPNIINRLNEKEELVMDILLQPNAETDIRLIAHKTGKSITTTKRSLSNIYSLFSKYDKAAATATYQSFHPRVGSEDSNTLFLIDRAATLVTDTFLETDIAFLLQLNEQTKNRQKINYYDPAKLTEIKKTIATPARLAAFVRGLEYGVIDLPPLSEQMHKQDMSWIINSPLARYLLSQSSTHSS